MANPEHLKILKQGVEVWNRWREENPEVAPDLNEVNLPKADLFDVNFSNTKLNYADLNLADLSGANISNASLVMADLSRANLTRAELSNTAFAFANLNGANLIGAKMGGTDMSIANLCGANLSGANLTGANLSSADFSLASLVGAELSGADFTGANLMGANLIAANLNGVRFVRTNLVNARLQNVNIYGISVWDIKKDGLIQKDLIITPPGEPEITVDDLDVAQFIYLMLNNQKIRDVIETITSKAVLILGRFTPERKAVLDAIKDELRLRNYLPIVFDFENASNKSIDETINLLARMSRFVIADITDAKSIPQELRGFVPDNPSIPIVPLIWKAQREYAMFDYFRNFPWVLPLHEYESPDALLKNIIPVIIEPVEKKVQELKVK